MNERFLSNTYLVADGEGGPGFFVDAGGPVAPLVEAAKRLRIEPTHVLLTHHHFDHVSEVGALRKHWPKLQVLIHPLEREPLMAMGEVLGRGVEIGTIEAGEMLRFGRLEVRPLRTPGHTAGMLSFLVAESARPPRRPSRRRPGPGRLSGGRRGRLHWRHALQGQRGRREGAGPHHLHRPRDSIMGTLMELPGETIVYPGHTDATSCRHGVGAERIHPRVARPGPGGL